MATRKGNQLSGSEESAALAFLQTFTDDDHRARGLTEAQSVILLKLTGRLERRDCRRRGVPVQ